LQSIEANPGTSVVTVSFNSDGTKIYAGFEDGKIMCWETR